MGFDRQCGRGVKGEYHAPACTNQAMSRKSRSVRPNLRDQPVSERTGLSSAPFGCTRWVYAAGPGGSGG